MLKKLVLVTAVAVGAVTALGGIAGATQSSDEQVQACVRPGSLELRLAQDGGTCKPNEQQVSWSKIGPQGAPGIAGLPGPQGVAGPQGAPGPQGLPGVTSVRVARGEFRLVEPGATATFVYGCPNDGWATSADPSISSADLVVLSLSPSEPAGARQVTVQNRGTAPASIKLDLVCAQVPPGVLQPGHDGASVQQFEAGKPVGPYTPATTSGATPSATDNGPVPAGNSDQVTWGPQGDKPLVDETTQQFAIAATAHGLMPDTEVVVKGWYVALNGRVDHVGHRSRTSPDGRTGVGHSGQCGHYKELVYSFTQSETTVVGRTPAPC